MFSHKKRFQNNPCTGFLTWKKLKGNDPNLDDSKSKLALTAFVHGLVAFHQEQTKHSRDLTCENKSVHKCLYIALRQCYELNLKSRKIVSKLIREMFLCAGNLNAIFSVFSFRHVTSPVSDSQNWMHLTTDCFTLYCANNRDGVELDDEVKGALSYYINNIVPLPPDPRERMTELPYVIHSILNRPIDINESITPLMASAVLRDPDLILLLLRHGADPLREMPNCECQQNPIRHIIKVLNSISAVKSLRKVRQGAQCIHDLAMEEQTALLCLEYCLRASPQIHIVQTSEYWNASGDEASRRQYAVHSKLADTLDMQRFKCPAPLAHLSRCVIRKSLLFSRVDSLPEAIKTLPLPFLLKQYIDLLM